MSQKLTASKIVCIGRNYADHAKELDNPIPDEPVIFIKPATCAVAFNDADILIDAKHETHFEAELVLEIGDTLTHATSEHCLSTISRVGVGLDLTRRTVQSQLKSQGYPWERAKAFDASAPISELIAVPKGQGKNKDAPTDWTTFALSLHVNEACVQFGKTADMLFDVGTLLANISETFTLYAGDLVMTGTPAGVGKLNEGDNLRLCLHYQDRKLTQNEARVKVI